MLARGIPRKTVINLKSSNIQIGSIGQIQFCCFDIPLRLYYGLLFLCISINLILFIGQIRNQWILGSLVLFQLYLIGNCLYQHFDFHIIKRWVFQFRCWLLILSMVINIYCTIQKLVWNVYDYENVSGILHVAFDLTTYNCAIFLCLCRDGMKQKFPMWFTILLCILVLFVSTWNAIFIEFDIENINDKAPIWFIELEKQGYYQVNFVMLLILISLYYDKNHAYFVLILQKSNRTDFYAKTKSYDIPSSMLNRQVWHKAKASDKSSNLFKELSRFYGSTSAVGNASHEMQHVAITPAPSDLNATSNLLTSPPATTNSLPNTIDDHMNKQNIVELSSTHTHDTHQSSLKSPLLQDASNINHQLSLVMDISHVSNPSDHNDNNDNNNLLMSLPSDTAVIQFKNDLDTK